MAFTITHTAATNGLSAKLSRMIDTYRERAEKRRIFRQTYRELSALTPRELTDLGLNRMMIRSVAFEAAYGTR